jgi:hypothetical protein
MIKGARENVHAKSYENFRKKDKFSFILGIFKAQQKMAVGCVGSPLDIHRG